MQAQTEENENRNFLKDPEKEQDRQTEEEELRAGTCAGLPTDAQETAIGFAPPGPGWSVRTVCPVLWKPTSSGLPGKHQTCPEEALGPNHLTRL